ncbi:MAG: amidohydrolase family protein, partial [Hyphomicrobiales bacterium]
MVTTAESTVLADRLLARPGIEPAQRSARIVLSGGLIEKISLADPSAAAKATGLLAMPALGNGHDHGRGVKFLSFGLNDKPLEAWVPAFYARPQVDAYMNGLMIMCRMAQSGIASAVHCHQMPQRPDDYEAEIEATVRAAHDIGMRLGLVVPLRDRNPLCYGNDETILSLVPAADRAEVEKRWRTRPLAPQEQVARAERLAKSCGTELVNVQLGPIGVQWASDRLLELVADASARLGLRVHMHLLESRYQREWLDATYPQGVMKFLDEIGLLSSRLTVAHGVWLRPDEMELLASRGVIVSLNTSSNLRLGSGIAPAREMVAKGVPVALGLDGLALDDDDDALREMRLADVLHR